MLTFFHSSLLSPCSSGEIFDTTDHDDLVFAVSLQSASPTASPTSVFSALDAEYDGNYTAPRCAEPGSECSSGDLLEGSGASETNTPNTVDDCKVSDV